MIQIFMPRKSINYGKSLEYELFDLSTNLLYSNSHYLKRGD